MTNFLQATFQNIVHALGQGADEVRHKIVSFFEKETVTVEDVAHFIQSHPETVVSQETMLDLSYFFYHLTIQDVKFYMETKGTSGEYILFVTVYTPHKVLFTYRSYDKSLTLTEPVEIEGIL